MGGWNNTIVEITRPGGERERGREKVEREKGEGKGKVRGKVWGTEKGRRLGREEPDSVMMVEMGV